MRWPLASFTALASFAVLVLGCTDNARWSTDPGESWCGTVTAATFVRAGMPENTQLRLELDAERLQSAPGRIWTSAFLTGEKLTAAELRVIPQMLHDPLSTLNFGEGRVKNAMTIVDVPSVDPGRPATQLLVVVSLLQSGDVEVRLIRGASPGTATTTEVAQLFGVFKLDRRKGDCGLP